MEKSFITSDDYHSNHNFVVSYNTHDWVSWNVDQGDGVYGNFEVTNPSSGDDQIITFFICDQANYDLWSSGQSASVYHLQENVASYSFEFRIPSDDTWYFVFRNYALFLTKTINFDLYMDLTPPAIDMNLDAGATYSGIKEITATITEERFDIDYVRLYIDGSLVDTEHDSSFSYSWNTASYSNGVHTVRIWASDNVGNSGYEEVTVTVSNYVAPTGTTDGGGTTGGGGDPSGDSSLPLLPVALGLIGLVVVVGIVGLARGRGSQGPPTTSHIESMRSSSPGAGEERVKEREVVSERFLVICPFCGSKNEQGTTKCQNCGADL